MTGCSKTISDENHPNRTKETHSRTKPPTYNWPHFRHFGDEYDALQAAIVHSTKKMALYQPYLAEWHYTENHHSLD